MASEWLKQLNEAKTDMGRAGVLLAWSEATREARSQPYVLEAMDKAGSTWVVGRFASMDALVAFLRSEARPKGCGFHAYNAELHDCDGCGEDASYSNGLTEDETDAFMEVV